MCLNAEMRSIIARSHRAEIFIQDKDDVLEIMRAEFGRVQTLCRDGTSVAPRHHRHLVRIQTMMPSCEQMTQYLVSDVNVILSTLTAGLMYGDHFIAPIFGESRRTESFFRFRERDLLPFLMLLDIECDFLHGVMDLLLTGHHTDRHLACIFITCMFSPSLTEMFQ